VLAPLEKSLKPWRTKSPAEQHLNGVGTEARNTGSRGLSEAGPGTKRRAKKKADRLEKEADAGRDGGHSPRNEKSKRV
jgi:hypothetical protein